MIIRIPILSSHFRFSELHSVYSKFHWCKDRIHKINFRVKSLCGYCIVGKYSHIVWFSLLFDKLILSNLNTKKKQLQVQSSFCIKLKMSSQFCFVPSRDFIGAIEARLYQHSTFSNDEEDVLLLALYIKYLFSVHETYPQDI